MNETYPKAYTHLEADDERVAHLPERQRRDNVVAYNTAMAYGYRYEVSVQPPADKFGVYRTPATVYAPRTYAAMMELCSELGKQDVPVAGSIVTKHGWTRLFDSEQANPVYNPVWLQLLAEQE